MKESPLFVKTCDLLAYLLSVSGKFPRNQRFVLGRRVDELGLAVLDSLLMARKGTAVERPALLRRADVDLDRLRYTVRLCRELELLEPKQYRHASRLRAD